MKVHTWRDIVDIDHDDSSPGFGNERRKSVNPGWGMLGGLGKSNGNAVRFPLVHEKRRTDFWCFHIAGND